MIRSTNIYAGQLAQRKVKNYYNFLEQREFSEEIMDIH
jgi:glutamate synthase domain-containing protein 1